MSLPPDPLDAIRALYFGTTRATIERDIAHAITLFKTLPDEAARERAAAFMDGLSQMRSEWSAGGGQTDGASRAGRTRPPAASSRRRPRR